MYEIHKSRTILRSGACIERVEYTLIEQSATVVNCMYTDRITLDMLQVYKEYLKIGDLEFLALK